MAGSLSWEARRDANGSWSSTPSSPTPLYGLGRLEEIRDNLIARISEAECEGWLGVVEGLRIGLAGSEDKLAQIDQRGSHAVDLGMASRAAGLVHSAMPTQRRT